MMPSEKFTHHGLKYPVAGCKPFGTWNWPYMMAVRTVSPDGLEDIKANLVWPFTMIEYDLNICS